MLRYSTSNVVPHTNIAHNFLMNVWFDLYAILSMTHYSICRLLATCFYSYSKLKLVKAFIAVSSTHDFSGKSTMARKR